MDYFEKLIEDIELHSIDGIRECFSKGVNPNQTFRNEPLIYELTSEYTRTSRFKHCVQAFVDFGLEFDDKVLLSVLLDDASALKVNLDIHPDVINRKYTLRCAYTPLYQATLLHICAEFNHLKCAKVLLEYGIDINVKAGVDDHGFGGQTPVFHTVNQNSNNSAEILNYFLDRKVDLLITVPGLIWGKSYEWETLMPSVNPISYAMMGLLPQMHRDEITIAATVSKLIKAAYQIEYFPGNVPCAYLRK